MPTRIDMQAGDFVMLPHGGPVDLRATRETRLLSGSLALHGTDTIGTGVMPAVLFTCGFRVHEPIFASLLETMHREASSDRAGSGSVIERLADVVASAAVPDLAGAGLRQRPRMRSRPRATRTSAW